MNIFNAEELLRNASPEAAVEQLKHLNEAFRAGSPIVSDHQYDTMRQALATLDPNNPFLFTVEPEALLDGKGRVNHPQPMLSTDKAYTSEEVGKWLQKVVSFASENGYDDLSIRLSPKLDGCAGRYNPDAKAKYVTRGDGAFGNDFTELGQQVVFVGDATVATVGELICEEVYFQDVLKAQGVIHPRNFVAGLLGADNLSDIGKQALNDGAVHFVSYKNMAGTRTFSPSEFKAILADLESVEVEMMSECKYRTDGIVIQVHSDAMFSDMGNNGAFHYGQIAKKIAGEPVEVIYRDIVYQNGRTGRLTPVIQIEPAEVGGVMVSNVTGHHAGNIKRLGVGEGSVLAILRSGEVIPKLMKVLKKSESVSIPSNCPCCDTETTWENDYLICPNNDCEGRVAAQLQFFAKTVGMDLIGGKSAEKLASAGIGCIGLLSITDEKLQSIGFGAGQSANILKELARIKQFPIEDYKVLASVGIRMLGNRASKMLLKNTPITEITGISRVEIEMTDGFGSKKADVILNGLIEQHSFIAALLSFFKEIKGSKIEVTESAVTGKNLVFTGTMMQGSRNDMIANAEKLGATIQSGVSGKTDFLVAGEKVGASKLAKAEKNGVKVISEQEYLDMISN
tara:strand:- start:18536 stop:20407 length:1872 start_codon:yes stop_codon:yes gene_type:complete